jgi:hypothetical protein
MKQLLCAVALLCAYAGAQTINPNQIRPGTQDGQVFTTVTANQPPSWQQVSSLALYHNDTLLPVQTSLHFSDNGTIAPDAGYTLAKFLPNGSGGLAAEYLNAGSFSGQCPLGIGGLAGSFTDGSGVIKQALCIGLSQSFVVPSGATTLLLGINDDKYVDNTGSFSVSAQVGGGTATNYTIAGTSMPWNTTTNPTYSYGINDGTAGVVAATGLSAGDTVAISWLSGTVSVGAGLGSFNANGNPANLTGSNNNGITGTFFPTKYMSGTYTSGAITALTGDVTATGPGSAAATLATVNSSPGTCGDATHVCQITTNGKGLTTGQTAVAITGGSSIPSGTTNQLLYYAASGPTVSPLTLGTGLSIASGALNASGGGTGGSSFTGSIVQSGIGYPSAPAIVSGFTTGTAFYYWCVAQDANGEQTPTSTAATGTSGNTGTMACGGQTGALKYYLLRTTADANPYGPPQNDLIGNCTTTSGVACNISDAATSPTSFQANGTDMTAVIDNGTFPPLPDSMGPSIMVGGLAQKQFTIAAGGSYTLTLTGEGAVTQIWLADPAFNTTLTITRDGEATPSVNGIATTNFFGVNFQNGATHQTRPFISDLIGGSSAERLQVDMPFTSGMTITLHNPGATADTIWLQVFVSYTKRKWGYYGHFHMVEGTQSVVPYAESSPLLNATGPGVLYGTLLLSVGGDGNLNYLEGPVRIYNNGEAIASYQSTGTEDYFLQNGYFTQCSTSLSVTARSFGCNIADPTTSRVEAYRFFPQDPVYFNSGLKITIQAGVSGIATVTNNVNYTLDSLYYTAN